MEKELIKRIENELRDIESEDLTKAEKNILRAIADYKKKRNDMILYQIITGEEVKP